MQSSGSKRTLVYLAGPYSDSPMARVMEAHAWQEWLWNKGYEVFSPHMTFYYSDLMTPHGYEFWLERCMAMVERCDIVIRMPGVSPGSDRESAHAASMGIPVLEGRDGLTVWEEAL